MGRNEYLNLRDKAEEFLIVYHLEVAATHVTHLKLALQMILDDERLQTVVILVIAKMAGEAPGRPGLVTETAVQILGCGKILSAQLSKLGL